MAQVIASYEAPPPDIATVILEAHGFADLIERVDDLRAISRQNASATTHVAEAQKAVTIQANHLATLESTHARETSAVLVQRNEVAQLHLALVNRQLEFIRARNRKSAELEELQSHKQSLEHELSSIEQRELAASGSLSYSGPVGAFNSTPEGAYGFFPAAGTNYSVGEEPHDRRTPEHDGQGAAPAPDRHLRLPLAVSTRSRSAASPTTRTPAAKPPTPPESRACRRSTLNQFGLTRPFPGAAEADHIQLVAAP